MSGTSVTPVAPKIIPVISASMNVAEILGLLPDSAPLLAQYGLSCFNCSANTTETLEDGCRTHGFSDEDLTDLVTDLNEMLKDQPERPQTLTLAKDAASQLKAILEAEGKAGWGLQVGLDVNGGFAMELVEKAAIDEKVFSCDDVAGVFLCASSMTLFSIGGATVDFRDGRFKLDLGADMTKKHECCQGKDEGECGNGTCGCQA